MPKGIPNVKPEPETEPTAPVYTLVVRNVKSNTSYLSESIQTLAELRKDGNILESQEFNYDAPDWDYTDWGKRMIALDKLRNGDNEERFIEL